MEVKSYADTLSQFVGELDSIQISFFFQSVDSNWQNSMCKLDTTKAVSR